ncbi:MAG TPA: DUF1190 domain-containing protein [Steroidobacteraceae bacterium]|nr:DUF1190 domain-containing protein [Steroidobacteraceae bacterium]
MKRSRSIELVLMGTVPLLLSACDQPSPPAPPAPPPQASVAYHDLAQCIADGKVGADICEKAYADAVQAQYRDGPRFDSQGECEAQYGYDQCHHVQTASGGWFMPALAGFMIGRALGDHHYYNYGYGYGGGFGQPLYHWRADRAQWRTASGAGFGGEARGPGMSVAETLSRGGFGMSSAARASWGG